MLKRLRLTTLLAALALAALLTTEVTQTQASCFASTSNGTVQGVDNGVSCAFLGIPFAAPPINSLRWKPPQPAAPWTPATFNAVSAPPACPNVNPPGSMTVLGNENCLRLNIWTPDPLPASPVPVIVWIHTGAFQAASVNLPDSNGRRLVETTGVIVVAANYRVGPLGFVGHSALTAEDPGYPSSGNYGLLDQRAALIWVRDHIAAFGGDPSNVTIAGQSAGGHSVGFHLASPASGGLFHRAIMMSGYASTRTDTLADAETLGHDFASAVGCTDPAAVLACMRSKTAGQVLLAFANGQQEYAETPRVDWGPNVDGVDVPDQPRFLFENGTFNRVPTILGATRDEGWIYVDRSFPGGVTAEQYQAAVQAEFGPTNAPAVLTMYPHTKFASPKHALSQLAGDAEAACEARRMARSIDRTRTPVYLYSFEREVDDVVQDLVIHGLDRNFVFGTNYPAHPLNDDDLALFRAIAGYWTRFAAKGEPNVDDDTVVRWSAFRHPAGIGRGPDKHIVLDWPVREDKRLREAQCDFWEPFFLRSIVSGAVPAWQ